ncbi:MAG TPA: holin family protein [Rhizorhapis sp.]
MSLFEGLIGPVAKIIDKIIPDPDARDKAKLELLKLEGSQEMEAMKTQLSAILAEAQSVDPWTSRARPSFLYVMYALLLWSVPMGLIAAARPEMAEAIAHGMNAYLNGIPESLYALFGTGYLGYTAARSLAKAKGIEK